MIINGRKVIYWDIAALSPGPIGRHSGVHRGKLLVKRIGRRDIDIEPPKKEIAMRLFNKFNYAKGTYMLRVYLGGNGRGIKVVWRVLPHEFL